MKNRRILMTLIAIALVLGITNVARADYFAGYYAGRVFVGPYVSSRVWLTDQCAASSNSGCSGCPDEWTGLCDWGGMEALANVECYNIYYNDYDSFMGCLDGASYEVTHACTNFCNT